MILRARENPMSIDAEAAAAAAPRAGALRVSGKHPERDYLQYLGFTQAGIVRAYHFRRIERGAATREFTVSADMTLFARHHVGIQEGPALSLNRLLATAPTDDSSMDLWPLSQALTEADMLACVASRRPTRYSGT